LIMKEKRMTAEGLKRISVILLAVGVVMFLVILSVGGGQMSWWLAFPVPIVVAGLVVLSWAKRVEHSTEHESFKADHGDDVEEET